VINTRHHGAFALADFGSWRVQLREWIALRPAGYEPDEDPPLIDSGNAARFLAAAISVVKDAQGEDAVKAVKDKLDVLKLYPDWEANKQSCAENDGLAWLL
jgi:hypothetical protein